MTTNPDNKRRTSALKRGALIGAIVGFGWALIFFYIDLINAEHSEIRHYFDQIWLGVILILGFDIIVLGLLGAFIKFIVPFLPSIVLVLILLVIGGFLWLGQIIYLVNATM